MSYQEVRPQTKQKTARKVIKWLKMNGNEFGIRLGKIRKNVGTSIQLLSEVAEKDDRLEYIPLSNSRGSRIRLVRSEAGW